MSRLVLLIIVAMTIAGCVGRTSPDVFPSRTPAPETNEPDTDETDTLEPAPGDT